MNSCVEKLSSVFCQYKSTRFVRVKDKKLAAVYYSTILLVLLYVALYTVWFDKGYQQTEAVVGSSSVKLKGTGSIPANSSFTSTSIFFENKLVFDAVDLVVPSIEENAFFLTTSIVATPNQNIGFCSADLHDLPSCSTNDDCTKGEYNNKSHGIITGECNATSTRCQVYGWCPLEDDSSRTIVSNVGTFSVLVKVDITFPAFDVTRTNVIDKGGDGKPIFGYNYFRVNDILSLATKGEINSADEIAHSGAIILAASSWDCNLDYPISKCNPKWNFRRIDDEPNIISKGFNFRTAVYDADMTTRTLKKLYGVRVVFITEGTGGQFRFAALTVTIGAGLAYLGVASFLADVVLENFLEESHTYTKEKFKSVSSPRSTAAGAGKVEITHTNILYDNND